MPSPAIQTTFWSLTSKTLRQKTDPVIRRWIRSLAQQPVEEVLSSRCTASRRRGILFEIKELKCRRGASSSSFSDADVGQKHRPSAGMTFFNRLSTRSARPFRRAARISDRRRRPPGCDDPFERSEKPRPTEETETAEKTRDVPSGTLTRGAIHRQRVCSTRRPQSMSPNVELLIVVAVILAAWWLLQPLLRRFGVPG